MIYAILTAIALALIGGAIIYFQRKRISALKDDLQDAETANEMLSTENGRLKRLADSYKKIEEETDAKKKKLHSGSPADNAAAATDAMSKLSRSRRNSTS